MKKKKNTASTTFDSELVGLQQRMISTFDVLC